MDKTWVNGRQFRPAFVDRVKQFMGFVRQRYSKQTKILCQCHRCLNHILQLQPEVHSHIHLFGMSSTYTRRIHHGESLGTDVIETSYIHESHHDDWVPMEEEYDNDNTLLDIDLVRDLFTAPEWVGKKSKFERVLTDMKRLVSP